MPDVRAVLDRARSPEARAPEPRVLLAAVAMIAFQLAFRGWAVWGSWFQFDDVVFISRLYDRPWSWDAVGHGYAGHLMPAGLSLTWLFVRLDPLGFGWYAATLLLLQALASVGFLQLLRSLFGDRWGILPPLAVYLFSAITLNSFIWWAAGINQLALQVALSWGVLAHLHYLRARQRRALVLTAVTMVACLLFYEKVLLAYGAIAFLTLAYFTQGSWRDRLSQIWTRYRPAVLVHVLCGVAYLAFYARFGLTLPEDQARSTPLVALTGNLVGRSWLPAMFGGPLDYQVLAGPFQLVDPPAPAYLAALLLAVALVLHVDRTHLRSRRAWLLPLFFLLCDLALVGAARANVIGATIGLEFRYISELGLVTPLAAALATMAVLGARESAEQRAPSPFLDNQQAVVFATAVVTGLSLISSVQFAQHWRGSHESREYFTNARRTLGTAEDPTPLVNVSVPQYLMWGFDYPRNTNRYVLAMYGPRMRFPDVAQDDLSIIDDRGSVRPVQLQPLATTEGPENGCVDRLTPRHSVRLRLTREVDGKDWWARMPYAARSRQTVAIAAGDTRHTVTLEPGMRNLFFTASGRFQEVRVTSEEDRGWVCVGNTVFGFPAPVEAPAEPAS